MNPFIDYWAEKAVDAWVWQMVQLYYAPFVVIVKGGEAKDFIDQFTLNGFKSTNLCKPE